MVAAIALVACDTTPRENTTGTPGAAGTAGEASLADERAFMEDFTKGNRTEIEVAQLAAERATNPEVREFAKMLVTDHTRAGEELQRLASTNNVTLGPGATEIDQDFYDRLSKLTGAEFDREFIDAMVDKHEDGANKLQDKAENADHAGLKNWASQTVPTVRQHLAKARELQEKVKG
jgi:putative membrane protein